MQRVFRQVCSQTIRSYAVNAPVVKSDPASVELQKHRYMGLKTSQLDIGTKVMTQDLGGSVAQLTFLYKDGPVYENLFNLGISSFMKHALTKDGLTTSEFITKTFLQKAGIIVHEPKIVNKSYIAFTIEGFRDTLTQASVMDKFWQSLLFPRFSLDSVQEVRRLLREETKEALRDQPFPHLMDVLHRAAFRGSPLGNSSAVPSYNLGYPDSKLLFDRWEAHYGFANIAVVGSNVDHAATLDALVDSPWLARAHTKLGGVEAPPSAYVGGEAYDVCHRSKEYDDQFTDVYNTFSAYAFKAPGRTNLKSYAAGLVIAQALTNAVSPVLRNSFAPHKVEVFYKAYDTVGLLGLATIQASAPQLQAFKAAVARMGALADADLEAHKSAALLAAMNAAESWRETQATLLDTYTTTGFPSAPQEIADAIRTLKAADVKAVVTEMLAAPATLVHHGDSPCVPTLDAVH